MSQLKDLIPHIQSLFPQHELMPVIEEGELVVRVPFQEIDKILAGIKRDPLCRFNQLMDVCGVDYVTTEKRFQLVYNLLSIELNHRIQLTTFLDETDFVPSVGHIYRSAPWYEREIWDMYGIKFSGHPDLRRILTDYGFEGHPLRKDFPLSGFTEVIYDEDLKRIKHQPVNLDQPYRD
ncbi:MAG: NADH-quinone oxidoreductase subunit C [Alphaproteobacteria bacterium]